MAGRQTKLTDKRARDIIALVAAGNYLQTAAHACGVHEATVHRWIAEGAKDDAPPPLRAFREAIERARAQAEVRVVGTIHEVIAGGAVKSITESTDSYTDERGRTHTVRKTTREVALPDGKLGLELLSRTATPRFGRRTAVEVSGPGGGPIELDLGGMASRLAASIASMRADPAYEAIESGQVRVLPPGAAAVGARVVEVDTGGNEPAMPPWAGNGHKAT